MPQAKKQIYVCMYVCMYVCVCVCVCSVDWIKNYIQDARNIHKNRRACARAWCVRVMGPKGKTKDKWFRLFTHSHEGSTDVTSLKTTALARVAFFTVPNLHDCGSQHTSRLLEHRDFASPAVWDVLSEGVLLAGAHSHTVLLFMQRHFIYSQLTRSASIQRRVSLSLQIPVMFTERLCINWTN